MKFLVMWELDLARLSTGVMHAVMRMPDYAQDVIKAPVTHYHTIQMVPRPKWAQGVTPTKQLGNHLFYAGVK